MVHTTGGIPDASSEPVEATSGEFDDLPELEVLHEITLIEPGPDASDEDIERYLMLRELQTRWFVEDLLNEYDVVYRFGGSVYRGGRRVGLDKGIGRTPCVQ